MLGFERVWLIDEHVLASLDSLGAHMSSVSYTKDGIDYRNVTVDNNEFIFIRTRDEE